MRVITENDIIVQKGARVEGFWSAASGKKKGGGLGAKAKDFVKGGGVQNLLDSLQGGRTQPSNVDVAPTPPPSPPKKKGLSTGAKIGIAVGVVAILGIGYYLYTKKKGK